MRQNETLISENKQLTLSDFSQLTKFRLSITVVISSIAGYFLAVDTVHYPTLLLLILGGYAMVGASNAFNQVFEKDLDKLMLRTQNRPLPTGRMQPNRALFIGVILTLIGISALYSINLKTAFFASLSIFLYACVYTPLKQKTPLSVFVGAFPGAIPFMLGWVAATNEFGIEPGVLFMIQFFWQFPHFWALGWMLHEDYQKAGINMLPTKKRDKSTALQIVLYSLWTIIISVFPVTGLTGDLKLTVGSAVLVVLLGLVMLFYSVNLYNKMNVAAAKKLFTVSILYLTLLQITYLIDKMYLWT